MNRQNYINSFSPENRNYPAREWDNLNHSFLSKLPAKEEILNYGMERVKFAAKECGFNLPIFC